MSNKPCIGITIGDFNGVGPELIIKTLSNSLVFNYCTPVVYGTKYILNFYADLLEYSPLDINIVRKIEDIKPWMIAVYFIVLSILSVLISYWVLW